MALSHPNYERINAAYNEVWHNTPYTSFEMFNYIITTQPAADNDGNPLGHWSNFLQKPSLESAGLKASSIDLLADESQYFRTGLCTLFTIQVVRKAKIKDITYGTSNGHRAAWEIIRNTAAVVDSSARQAIHFRDQSKSQRINDTIWLFVKRNLWMKKMRCAPVAFSPFTKGPEAWKKALQIGLIELLKKHQMLIMIRRSGNWNGFCGKIMWDFRERTFTWSSTKQSALNVVTFHPSSEELPFSSPDANGTAILVDLSLWINEVKWRKEQFSPELRTIQEEVWAAAVKHWGVPRHRTIEQVPPESLPSSQVTPAKAAVPCLTQLDHSRKQKKGEQNPLSSGRGAPRRATVPQPVPPDVFGKQTSGRNALLWSQVAARNAQLARSGEQEESEQNPHSSSHGTPIKATIPQSVRLNQSGEQTSDDRKAMLYSQVHLR